MPDERERMIIRKLEELASDIKSRAVDIQIYDAHIYPDELIEFALKALEIARDVRGFGV